MKKVIAIIVLSCLMGCMTKTEFGPCVGAWEDKKPQLIYKINPWNLFLGAVFFQLILPPIFVLTDETFCPVGVK